MLFIWNVLFALNAAHFTLNCWGLAVNRVLFFSHFACGCLMSHSYNYRFQTQRRSKVSLWSLYSIFQHVILPGGHGEQICSHQFVWIRPQISHLLRIPSRDPYRPCLLNDFGCSYFIRNCFERVFVFSDIKD